MRRAGQLFLALIVILIIAAGAGIWWFAYRPLPQVDGTVSVNGLHSEVTVNRDGWGIPHIRASSTEDMVEAQGYVIAQDRLWQMDLLRRVVSRPIVGNPRARGDFRRQGISHPRIRPRGGA